MAVLCPFSKKLGTQYIMQGNKVAITPQKKSKDCFIDLLRFVCSVMQKSKEKAT